jgi:23S rRNA (cytosine1962-C5)-methyltransferase
MEQYMKSVIYLKSAKKNTFIKGHPWIFPKSIHAKKGNPKTGDLVAIHDEDDQFLGAGIYNETSLYQVRVLTYAFEKIAHTDLNEIINTRLLQAKKVRGLLDLPNGNTNAYRLCNSEADGLSGLTIDCFNQSLVVSSSAYWVELNRTPITAQLQKIFPKQDIKWFSQIKSLQQDGYPLFDSPALEGCETILEEGVQFSIDFANPQKTGLFIDQRDNHQRIARLAYGKKVLDLYCYSGGFALHAAKAGAHEVTAVDSSEQAIMLAKKNAELNGLSYINFIQDDARKWLERAGDYDIVILDPPKLVPSKKHLERAKNYYRFLHREIFKVMQSGSLLLSCNCSAALSTQEFTELIARQATHMNRMVRVIGVYGPANCHPVLPAFPEGQYLTAVLLAIV